MVEVCEMVVYDAVVVVEVLILIRCLYLVVVSGCLWVVRIVHWWLMGTCWVGILETILYGGDLMRQLVVRCYGLGLRHIYVKCHWWLRCMPIC